MALTLLEKVECNLPPAKMPKLDYGEPTVPAKPQPVWLRRAIGAIATGRANLDKAKTKLAAFKTKAAQAPEGKKKTKAEIDVACQELRVKSAEARLDKSLKKWKMLIAKVKEVYDPVTKAHKDAMAFGSKMAGDAQIHLDNHDNPNAEIPPVPDVKFDQKKGLVNSAGEPINVPDADADEAPPPPPPAVPKPKPVNLLDVPTKDKLKAKFKAAIKAGGPEVGIDGKVLKDLGIEPKGPALGQIAAAYAEVKDSLTKDGLTPLMYDDVKKVAEQLAGDMVTSGEAWGGVGAKLQAACLQKLGFMPTLTMATDMAADALVAAEKGKQAKAKDLDDLTTLEKAKLTIAAKTQAIAETVGLGLTPAMAKHKVEQTFQKEHGLSPAAASILADGALKHVGKDFDALTMWQQEALIAKAKAGLKVGKSVAASVAEAALVGLSEAGLNKLANKVIQATKPAKPDVSGFVKEMTKIIEASPPKTKLPANWFAFPAFLHDQTGKPIVAYVSQFHLGEDGIPASAKDQVEAALHKVMNDRADKAGFKKNVFAFWDAYPSASNLFVTAIKQVHTKFKIGDYTGVGHYLGMVPPVYNGPGTLMLIKTLYEEWKAEQESKKSTSAKAIEDKAIELLSGVDPNDLSDEQVTSIAAAAKDLGVSFDVLGKKMMALAAAATAPPPAPAPTPIAPAPAPAPEPKYTKFKKISKLTHLTTEQKEWLEKKSQAMIASGVVFTQAGTVKTQLGGLATKIGGEFKSCYASAGVTGLGKSLVTTILSAQIKKALDEPGGDEATLKAGYLGADLSVLAPWEQASIHATHKAVFDDKLYVGKKKGGSYPVASFFADEKQKAFYEKLLKKALAAAPATPVVTAGGPTLSLGVPTVSNTLGMSEAQLAAYIDINTPPPGAPKAPDWDEWDGVGPSGSGGSHSAKWSTSNADGVPTGAGEKASHRWLHKLNAGVPAMAEVAAYRAQSLLGGATETAWLAQGPSGGIGMTSHFKEELDIRTLEGSPAHVYPWKNTYATEQTIRDLQQAHIINWLIDEHDDHGGNFVIDQETGRLRSIDHGQAGKFFRSDHTMLDDYNWEPPKGTFQDSGKGVPRKTLKAFAVGESVALSALTDPQIVDTMRRAAAIPDETWRELWRPYAEAAAEASCAGNKKCLGGFSPNAKDKTVDGFLQGMIDRKNNMPAQVEQLYTQVAATRAGVIAAKEGRALDEVKKEIEEALGLPGFRDLMKTKFSKASPDAAIVADALDIITDWDGAATPQTSRVPAAQALKKAGQLGTEFAVPSDDIKGGRVELIQMGDDRVVAAFWMERSARAALQSRLGWGGVGKIDSPPVKPEKPPLPTFTPPAAPTGLKSSEQIHDEFWKSGGMSSFTPEGATAPMTKIGKYVDKWAKGMTEGATGEKHLANALKKAREMAESGSPMEAAAGEHYVAEILRIGSETGPSGFTWKPVDTITGAKGITPFSPSPEVKAAAQKGMEAQQAAYDKKVADAKKKHQAAINVIESKHQKALATWEKSVEDYEAKKKEKSGIGTLKAQALSGYRVPNVTWGGAGGIESTEPKSSWNGATKKAASPGTAVSETYKIDLGDGLIVHYVPGATSVTTQAKADNARSNVGVSGLTRIQFPKGATREQQIEGMKKAAAALGIALRPASKKEQELTYLRRMAWLRNIEGAAVPDADKAIEPEGTTQAKIDFWLEQFSQPTKSKGGKSYGGYGHDPRFVPERTSDGEIKKTASGAVVYKMDASGQRTRNALYQPEAVDMGGTLAHRRWDITDKELDDLVKKGVTLYHGGKQMSSVINNGALLSTEERWLRGITIGGESSGQDRGHGGSYEVFVRNNFSAGGVPSATKHQGLYLSPRLLGFTSAYSVPGETWGTKVQNGYGSPQEKATTLAENSVVEHTLLTEMLSKQAGGETTINSKIAVGRWLSKHKTGSETARQKAIALYKSRGIHEIDGKKVEDVFTV